jgi:hypothetical protein
MKTQYEIAEDVFSSGDYVNAFQSFKDITESNSSSAEEKADSFNMMGVIVLIDTRVENNDESGLEYFIKSLKFDPRNIGALLNIVEGFGLSINNHRNIEMFDYAVLKLAETIYHFTERDQEMLNWKKKLREKLIQESYLNGTEIHE